MDCIFCKIAAGEIPSKKLYEDELVYAFYDIAPVAPVHFLIIPKQHILQDVNEVTAEHKELIGHIFTVAAKLAGEQKLDGGYRIVTNVGADAGQTVSHIHFHVIGGATLGAMA